MADGARGKELKVNITGNADKLGEAAKKAEGYIRELKNQGLDALTGGLYTGGAIALAEKTIQSIKAIVTELKEIVSRAASLNVNPVGAIELKALGNVAGMSTESTDSSVQQLRRMRSDALAGDDNAVKAFEALGLTLEEISKLSPDKLFKRVLEATVGLDLTAQRFFVVTKLIGEEAATKILPFTRDAGTANKFFTASTGVSVVKSSPTYGPMSWLLDAMGAGPASVAGSLMALQRKNFEPFSTFGLQNKEQAEFAAEQNRQRLLAVGRTQLSTEERINEVIGERLRLVRMIESEQDPVKRQKFIADAIAVEAELAGLVSRRAGEVTATRSTQTQDPLRAIGADFSRFSPTLGTEIGKQQLSALRELRATLDAGLRRLETTIDRSIGGNP